MLRRCNNSLSLWGHSHFPPPPEDLESFKIIFLLKFMQEIQIFQLIFHPRANHQQLPHRRWFAVKRTYLRRGGILSSAAHFGFSHQLPSFYTPPGPPSLQCILPTMGDRVWLAGVPVTVLESTNTCLDSSPPPSPSSHHQRDHLHHHWAQSCSKSWSPNSFDTCLNTCLRRNCVGTQDTKDLAGWSARHSLVKSMCIAWLNNI